MGWEHDRYVARCADCGSTGIVIESSDDWGRRARRYEGFDMIDPPATAIARRRQDRREANARCQCGGTTIEKGARVS